jgi:hypothetical protein
VLLLGLMTWGTGCAGTVQPGGGGNQTTPPATLSITAVSGIATASDSATITWTTNLAANSQVDYGTTTSYGQSTPLNSSMVTSHRVTLSGLAASTTYHYRVKGFE